MPPGISGHDTWHEKRERHHHPKTDVPVTIVRVVPVAVRTARVPVIVIERAAPHHTGVVVSQPPQVRPAGRRLPKQN